MLLPEVKAEQDPHGIARPLRPDLPWLRNLSWVKIHAMQIGFAIGLVIFWGFLLGQNGVVFGLVVFVVEYVFGKKKKVSNKSECDHSLGVHDLRLKPWYGLTSTLLTLVLGVIIWGIPV